MRPRGNRGFAIPAVAWVIVTAGAALFVAVPNFRPSHWFQKDEIAQANQQLVAAQTDLAKAKTEAATAQAALLAAQAAERARKDEQVRYAQEMTTGAAKSLETAPPSPHVALAQSLLARANPALTTAIGALPAAQQDEIIRIVNQSLSGLTDQLAEAKATLATRDGQLAAMTAQRESLKAQIPQLQSQLDTKDAVVLAVTTSVAEKTQLVVAQAEKIQAKEREAGSLTAQISNLGRLVIIGGLVYLFIHFILPCLAQEFPGFKFLGVVDRTVKSITSARL